MEKDIWDNTVPVEKSPYLCDNEIKYFGLDTFKYKSDKLAMLDLFCGAGGFAVGCDWAGFQSVFGIDHLEPAMKTWCKNHPHSIGCLGDITQLKPEDIKELLESKGVTQVHLITGGVPCQGFSIANRKHNDNDERNFLFLEYMKFVEVFQPDYIILENVSGMRSTAGGQFEKDIKKYMSDLGYEPTVELVNAADFGVPQIRQRLIFVGVKRDRGLTVPYAFPAGSFAGKYRTVSDAISDLPELGNNETKTDYMGEPHSEYQKLMRGYGEIKGIPVSATVKNHVSPNHPKETIAKIANTPPGQAMYKKFKQRIRLKNDAPSPTQMAGGIRPQFQFGHPDQSRGLTIRERARIQSFPDSYEFCGGIVQSRVQTGNAVPPLLIYHIAKPIADDIRRKDGKDNVQSLV
ncbi:MAG: DNA cytosine methyltransferase [Candidatus Heteroscillospira sp.]